MTHPELDIVPASPKFPESVDTVVIGGGIAGVTAALELVERGQSVAIVEKGEIAAEQSCRNWGWVRIMGRDAAEYPLAILSLNLWDSLEARTGAKTGFRRSGIYYTAESKRDLKQLQAQHKVAAEFGIDCQLLSASEFAKHEPSHTGRIHGALYSPSCGRAEPSIAVSAMARAAQSRGAHILTNCAARGLETKAGTVAGVATERGTIVCNSVILAGGVWSRAFAGNIGIGLPSLNVVGTVLRTAPMEGASQSAFGNRAIGVRRRQDGGLTLASRSGSRAQITPDSFRLFTHYLPRLTQNWGEFKFELGPEFLRSLRLPATWTLDETSPFEKERVHNPPPNARAIAKSRSEYLKRFANVTELKERENWAGTMDVTPDVVPVISETPIPGLVLSTGYSGHGFGIGAGAGRLTADLVCGTKPCVDPAPFRLSRFRQTGTPAHPKGLREMAAGTEAK